MIIFAWNCRGLGQASAIRDLRALINSSKPDCLILMETKINAASMSRIVGNLNFSYHVYVPPIGLSGGFCVAWKDSIDMEPITLSKNIISLLVFSKPGIPWRLSAVYGPPNYSAKRAFWSSLSSEADRFPGAWILLGDFNGIYNRQDRSSNRRLDGGSRIMCEALDNLGMITIPSSGFFYSWSNRRYGRQRVNSRIDRGVANEDWWRLFPNARLQLLPQTSSDHHPQVLSCFGQNMYAKRPFRFEAAWVEDRRYYGVVNHAWSRRFHPRPPTNLLYKLQDSRVALSRWNKEQFGNIQSNIKATTSALAIAQQNLDSPTAVDHDRDLRCHLEHLLKMEETLWFQKSRLKWKLEGDRCTRFFFLSTLTRRKFSRIDHIKGNDGQWLTSRDQIGQAFMQRFLATYDEPIHSEFDLHHLISPTISDADNALLLSIPDWEEIRTTVFKMGSFKAAGPDGFPSLFFKSYWEIVGEDVISSVRDFFITGTLHPYINSTNIVLVPKSKTPSNINHFQPIAVCNVIYKVISKLLAERLKPLLTRLICPTQGAFVPGHSIHDNSIIIQEIIHAMKKKKGSKGWMGLKIDLQKAYDRLSWQFLEKVLKAFGFHPVWIHRVITSGHFKDCLDQFCSWSGQTFNALKSNIFFSNSASSRVAGQVTGMMGFSRIAPNSVYLGLPLFRTGKIKDFDFLIEQLDSKLVGWKSKALSKAKRAILIQSVALSVPLYTMQTTKIPLSVCSKLDSRIRSFWWGRSSNGRNSLCLKAWDAICKPKSCGGLGFRRLKDVNAAILSNWGWKILTGVPSLCLSILRARYLHHKCLFDAQAKAGDSPFWKSIIDSVSLLKEGACYLVGDGCSIDPWKDPWVPNAENFRPNLISEAGVSNVRVKDFLFSPGVWDVHKLSLNFTHDDARLIAAMVLPVRPSPDRWAWLPASNGKFSTKSAYLTANKGRFSNGSSISRSDWLRIWGHKLVLPRHKLNWWLILSNALPTRDKLNSIFHIDNVLCPICNDNPENSLHLLFFCVFSRKCWLASPWNIRTERLACQSPLEGLQFLWSVEDMDYRSSRVEWDNRNIMLFASVLFDSIWKYRNSIIHGGPISTPTSSPSCAAVEPAPWTPPPTDWIKVNSDAAISISEVVIACVARDCKGVIISWSSRKLSPCSPLMAEALALELALKMACDAGWKYAIFASDSKIVIDALNSRNSDSPWAISSILDNCSLLVTYFSACSLVFAPRLSNLLAHNLAKWCLACNVFSQGSFDLPSSVCSDTEEWML
ncbi:hypothetical protein UlMin_039727 [Ulmus minor]